MGKDTQLSNGTLALLLISFSNLCLIALPVLYHRSQPEILSEQLPRGASGFGSLSLGLGFSSQILYLVFSAAWLFRWIHFYPGNPIQNITIMGGLALSVGAFVTALLGVGIKRYAGALSSVITAGLWLLSAVASVAV
jgi:hypothetical protein